MNRHFYNLDIALEAVSANKFRSILTALGIIFGVAAVIAMLAIGNGARQEILEQMKLVGVNNIIVTPGSEVSETGGDEDSKSMQKTWSPGLTMKDVYAIRSVLPELNHVSPEVQYNTYIIKDGIRKKANLVGVEPSFFDVFNLDLEQGEVFNAFQMEKGEAVCLIGSAVKAKFFTNEDAIGKYIKCGHVWLKVLGVLESRKITTSVSDDVGISVHEEDIFAPITTVLMRYSDRSKITQANLSGGDDQEIVTNGFAMSVSSGSGQDVGNNQLNRIVVQVKSSENLSPSTEVLRRLLIRRHSRLEDFEIKVPELLLKQEQRTKDIFNIVLGAIASISLIVGGIGIMNIMLASVMERTREMGTRRAIGARKSDIIFQFVAEATIISITGGLIGIVLGVTISQLITRMTDILTIVSFDSIIISFGVSAAVGILFGYMPARRAAEQDPVMALRYE